MKVKDLKELLEKVDDNSEIVSPFIFVSDKTVHGFTPINGFRYINVNTMDSYFVEADDGKKVLCVN